MENEAPTLYKFAKLQLIIAFNAPKLIGGEATGSNRDLQGILSLLTIYGIFWALPR